MTKKHLILIVDDEESITFLLKTEFEDVPSYDVDIALNGSEAINLIQSKLYDVVLLDIKMPRVSGIEVLKFIAEHSPTTQIIMLTNVVDVKTAIETVKLGAYDFVSKPYDRDQLFATVQRALERRKLVIEKEMMKKELMRIAGPGEMVGESSLFRETLSQAKKIAASDAFVLIYGASGTGKELMAHFLHQHSARSEHPFVAVNCASIPDQLLESELFGHEKGSFTSAVATKQGLVEVAHRGTLFLDEVGDISSVIQPKLLRFLETGEFRRVGGTRPMKVDVRVISATNKNLQDEAKAGRFREDLLYRLNVVSIRLPLLRERKEDILLLVEHFLRRKAKSPTKRMGAEAIHLLQHYDWPGNIRELEHVVEGAMILSQGEEIQPADLWINTALTSSIQHGTGATAKGHDGQGTALMSLEELEKIHIERVLRHNNWSRVKSAEMLGITPKTLYLKIKRYRIKVGNSTGE
jgi:two-component system NtrC family response regulator